MPDMHARLTEARLAAGYKSRKAACDVFGWGLSTYSAHENGQNKYNDEVAREYAKAFKTSPEWLLFGTQPAQNQPAKGSIDAQLKDLPEEVSKKLIDRFNAMIEGARLIGRSD